MSQDPKKDINPYAAIAIGMAWCGSMLMLCGVGWRAFAACYAAAIVAIIVWVRS